MSKRSFFLISPPAFVEQYRGDTVVPRDGQPFLFRLDEYAVAFSEFLQNELHRLANEQVPLLAEFETQHVDAVRAARLTTPSGDALTIPPTEDSFEWSVDVREILDFDLATFNGRLRTTALQNADARIASLLGHATQVSDAFGNVHPLDGEFLTWPALFRILDQFPLDFDEGGEPQFPYIIDSWNRRRITPYPPIGPEQRETYTKFVDRKRHEFDARSHRGQRD
jgi:hypothetical protein